MSRRKQRVSAVTLRFMSGCYATKPHISKDINHGWGVWFSYGNTIADNKAFDFVERLMNTDKSN